jgi:hypothetical protein
VARIRPYDWADIQLANVLQTGGIRPANDEDEFIPRAAEGMGPSKEFDDSDHWTTVHEQAICLPR